MNEFEMQHLTPRYFRLLEKGETIECSDLYATEKTWEKVDKFLETGVTYPGNCTKMLRSVQVDEWISYAERKPTKEDFEPTGKIDVISAESIESFIAARNEVMKQ